MAVDLSCRQVFLASPGGLSAERKACRKVFRRHNETYALESQSSFFVHAWEDVPGGIGRPQDLINPNLDKCDFVLLLLGDRWGTPPAHGGKFTSGTEEEFFRALDLLADGTSPMRDVLVLFKTVDTARMRDPGDELKSVLKFRARLEASKSLMYENFDSLASLTRIVERKMHLWSKSLDMKEPRIVVIPDAEIEAGSFGERSVVDLVAIGDRFVADGLLVQAEAAFAAATKDGDAEALLHFGQFMRRTGRLEQAMTLNRQVVENPHLLCSSEPDAIRLRVQATSNIGVIQRKLGDITTSILTLREAARTAESAKSPIASEQCYALDNLGLSLLRATETAEALQQFQLSDRLRREFGTTEEQAQSAINLGRQHLALGQYPEALEHFSRALDLLGDDSDAHLQANAAAGEAEALIRMDRDDQVDDKLQRALEANGSVHNRDGLSIVHGLWARSLLKRDRVEDAAGHVNAAEAIISETGNAQGRAVVAWLRAQMALSRGDRGLARALVAEVEERDAGSLDRALRTDFDSLRRQLQED